MSRRTFDRLPVGTRIADYIIEGDLRSSSEQYQVYSTSHLALPRKARLVLSQTSASSVHVMRQAFVLEGMRHANVPRVLDSGSHEGRSWLATEIQEGERMADRLRNAPLSLTAVVTMIRDVATVLEHAHARGVVHRAVRAESIVCGARGAVLVDWDQTASSVRVDPACDLHALASVADAAAIEARPGQVWSTAHDIVRQLVASMLSPDPAKRPSAASCRAESIRILAMAVVAEPVDTNAVPPLPQPRAGRRTARWTRAQGVPRTELVAVGVWDGGYFLVNDLSQIERR